MNPETQQAQLAAQQEALQCQGFATQTQQLVISNDVAYQTSAKILLDTKERIKAIEAKRKSFVQPLNAVVKSINAFFKAPLDEYKSAEENIKRAMGNYNQLKAEERRVALQAAAAAVVATPAAPQQQATTFNALMQNAAQNVAPEAAGTFTRQVWKFEIIDPSQVPREYWVLDESKIRGVVNTLKGGTSIPGVRVWEETGIVARGTK